MSSLYTSTLSVALAEPLFTYRRGHYEAAIRPVAVDGFARDSDSVLVALHGMVETPDIWMHTAAALAPAFGAGYMLELPWHGEDGYLWGLEAKPDEWLEPLVDALPPGRKVFLAHSFGANSFLALLSRRLLLDIQSLVLLSPYYKRRFESFDWNLFQRYVNEFDTFLERSISIRPGAERLRPASVTAIVAKLKETYGSFSWLQFFSQFSQTPSLDLERMPFPTLIVGGDEDLSIPVSDLQLLAESMPQAWLTVLRGCGHFGMLEREEELILVIREFIDNHKE